MDKVLGSQVEEGQKVKFSPFGGSAYEVFLDTELDIKISRLWCIHNGDTSWNNRRISPTMELYWLDPNEVDAHQEHLSKRKESR